MDYPNEPGFRVNAPETSREAAQSIAPLASSIRARVRSIIYDAGPLGIIADDIADSLGLNVYQCRARISELRAANEIADSGRRALGASGRRTAIWVAKQYAPPEPDCEDVQAELWARAA